MTHVITYQAFGTHIRFMFHAVELDLLLGM